MGVPPTGEFVVRKSFETEGVLQTPGSIVNVDGWRNARKLLDIGYIRPVEPYDRKPAPNVLAPDPVIPPVEAKEAPAKRAPAKKAAAKSRS